MVFGKKTLVYPTKTITYGVRFQVIWRWCLFINKAVWFLTSIKKYYFFSPKHLTRLKKSLQCASPKGNTEHGLSAGNAER